jgi:xanthine dehydrogenase small subunit
MSDATSTRIGFVLNGHPVTVAADVPAATSLLDWLRGPAGLTGTKEGCAEGDCGACTVVLEDAGRTPVNACLTLLGQLHGRALRTVEGLRDPAGAPHPVQTAMAQADATQCGFCTPGIVMSAWAHAQQGGDVHDALAGNLCRCTGYRPILAALAGLAEAADPPSPAPPPGAGRFTTPGQVFHLPATMTELLSLRAAHPDALLLAGGTDLGLLVSEGRELLPSVICLLNVPELQRIEARPDGLLLGAAVSYERLLRRIGPDDPLAALAPLLRRLGSRQIRGLGTLGGNLGTASPIGDALPPLLALGATVTLRSRRGARELPVEAFLLGYRRTALAPDEVIESVFLPHPPEGSVFACEKLSKRHDQDISAVGAALLLQLRDGRVAAARLAFGGMGPMPARAPQAEAALLGAPWSAATIEQAAAALAADFAPLSDWRATAAYRAAAAANLLRRLWWRQARPDLPLEVHAL